MSEENVQVANHCWNCNWRIWNVNYENIIKHSCFANFNEYKYCLLISTNGIVSMKELSAKEKKCAVEVRLIRAHYERPGLYNKEAQRSVSPEEREQLWQEVAEIVCTEWSGADAKKKWRNLRDQFKKALKKGKPELFRHYNEMIFLEEDGNDGDTLDDSVLRQLPTSNSVLRESPASNSANKRLRRSSDFSLDGNDSDIEFNATSATGTSRNENNENAPHSGIIRNDELSTSSSQKKDKTLSKKEELQMLILEKIQSHKIPKADHTDMLFSSFSATFKQLQPPRQLRVHRLFIEILEREYNEQITQEQYDLN